MPHVLCLKEKGWSSAAQIWLEAELISLGSEIRNEEIYCMTKSFYYVIQILNICKHVYISHKKRTVAYIS